MKIFCLILKFQVKSQVQENDNVINRNLTLEDVNVQIGNFNSREKVEKTTGYIKHRYSFKVSNESISIKLGNNKNNYSINIREINYLLAKLMFRLEIRDIECVISNNK